MATTTKSESRRVELPAAPDPSALSAPDGLAEGRELARRYWVDLVRFHAGVALSPLSEASLHTRVLSAKEIRGLAFGMPAAVPEAPQPGDGSDLT